MILRTLRRAAAVGLGGLALLCPTALAAASHGGHDRDRHRTLDVQVLAINDFHGNLEPPGGQLAPAPGQTAVDVGGIEYLATHVRDLRATNPRRTVTVSAGDLVGASPLLSALFHDEPTVEAMNLLGLDLNAVGNHEFDEGAAELRRLQRGGCHPVDGCQDGDAFGGADFRFLAANVVDEASGRTVFPAAQVRRFQNVKVGFIGLTLKETPEIVTPSGVAGLRFEDEAATINRVARRLDRRGVKAIVVLLHQGGTQSVFEGIDGCGSPTGPIVDIVKATTKKVDAFVTGHTHQTYNCVIDGRPVTSAGSQGKLLTDIDLSIDRRTRDVTAVRADNRLVTRDVPKAADETALLDKYGRIAAPLRDRVVGKVAADLTRTQNAAGESALGDVIADAQLEATAGNGAVAALMNPGGIRENLLVAPLGGEQPGEVTYGEAFAVQPFGNVLQTLTLTGAQLDEVLEQQWCGQTRGPRILQVAGLTYSWSDAAAPCADKVDAASIRLGGQPVSPTASYRITVNNFLADGGDGFTALRQGTDRAGGGVDLDAFVAYFERHGTVSPPPLGRITRTP